MDDRLLIEAIAYFRKHQKLICDGDCKLTLPASLLHKINLALEEYNDNNSVPVFQNTITDQDFKCLSDIICNTPKLVITQSIKIEKWSVDVGRFEKLQYLEVYNIPINSIEGIKSLRHQLRVLVCHNVSNSIVDLIGRSDLWEELHTAKWCYNGFDFLIQSYNTPWLQYLDLSHNKLKGEITLEKITNLKYLNLNFNCLDCLPVLSEEAYCSLKILLLSNNFIQDLSMVHLFNALEDLDVSYNILTDHSALRAIVFLSNLRNLNLLNNPISYNPFHRMYTCQNINKSVNPTHFLLDGRLLNTVEKKIICNFHDITNKNIFTPQFKTNSLIQPGTERKTTFSKIISKATGSQESSALISPRSDKCILKTKNVNQKTSEANLHSYGSSFSEKLCFIDLKTECCVTSTTQTSTDISCVHAQEQEITLDNCSPFTMVNKHFYPQKFKSHLIKENMSVHDEVKFLYLQNQDRLDKDLLAAGINPAHLTSNFEQSNKEHNQPYCVISTNGDSDINTIDSDNESTSSVDSYDNLLLAKKLLTNGRYLDVIVVLDESYIREKSIIEGNTLFSWSLKSVLSCEYLSFNPTSVHLVFNKTLKEFRDRTYVMDDAAGEKLMKNVRLFLETRSLGSMNQNVYRCLKCNSIFSQEHRKSVLFPEKFCKSNALKHKSEVKCYTCGSTLVIIEEDKIYSKLDFTNHHACDSDSDIEVISNPSQRSIDVLD